MSGYDHYYIVPVQKLSHRELLRSIRGEYHYMTPGFVLRVALQIWVDYLQDPDGDWYLDAENEVDEEYGKIIGKEAGRVAFREGRNDKIRDRSIKNKKRLKDSMLADAVNHIVYISDIISMLLDDFDLHRVVKNSDMEISIINAALIGRSLKFHVKEI